MRNERNETKETEENLYRVLHILINISNVRKIFYSLKYVAGILFNFSVCSFSSFILLTDETPYKTRSPRKFTKGEIRDA